MVFTLRNLLEAAARDNTVRLLIRNARIVLAPFELVMLLDQQPVRLPLIRRLAAHANQRPLPLHLPAMQDELQRTRAQSSVHVRMSGLRLPRSLVPDHNRPAAVLPLRNDALKTAILHRMIFHLHREPFVAGKVARPLRNRPALQYTIPPKPKIVVQMRSRMLLNDKRQLLLIKRRCLPPTARLTGNFEVPHRAVPFKLLINRVRCGRRLRLGPLLCSHRSTPTSVTYLPSPPVSPVQYLSWPQPPQVWRLP